MSTAAPADIKTEIESLIKTVKAQITHATPRPPREIFMASDVKSAEAAIKDGSDKAMLEARAALRVWA